MPTWTNTWTITPTSTVTPSFTVTPTNTPFLAYTATATITVSSTITATFTPVGTPYLILASSDDQGNITFIWDNGVSDGTFAFQYGTALENTIGPIQQTWNVSKTSNQFCYKLCCLEADTSMQFRVTRYSYSSGTMVSNIVVTTPTPVPLDIIVTPTP